MCMDHQQSLNGFACTHPLGNYSGSFSGQFRLQIVERECMHSCNNHSQYNWTQPCDGSLPGPIKVVGMGSCGVDYLASVAAYPQPDQKLRTEMLEVGRIVPCVGCKRH